MLDKPIDWHKIAFGNIIHTYELAELTCVDVITAVGSYMVRPRFFTPELWEALYIHESHSPSSSRLRGKIVKPFAESFGTLLDYCICCSWLGFQLVQVPVSPLCLQ